MAIEITSYDHVLVLRFSGPCEDEDIDTLCERLAQVLVASRQDPQPLVIVDDLLDQTRPANAGQRKRITEAFGDLDTEEVTPLSVLVSDSLALRGVLKAMSWVAPKMVGGLVVVPDRESALERTREHLARAGIELDPALTPAHL